MVEIIIDRKIIELYCSTSGAYQVWLSWKDGMKSQGREIKEHQEKWDTMKEEDKDLDRSIAENIIDDFLTWLAVEYKDIKVKEIKLIGASK